MQFAMAMELPFVIVGSILTGGFFGYLLDRWLHTGPMFLLALGFLGFFAGVKETLRRLKMSERRGGNNQRKREDGSDQADGSGSQP